MLIYNDIMTWVHKPKAKYVCTLINHTFRRETNYLWIITACES